MAGEDRLIDLDMRRSRGDQSFHLLSEGRREIDGERLSRLIVLVLRERGEGHWSGEDRLNGCLRVRLGELPFVHEEGPLSNDGSADDGLAVVRIRVEIADEPVDLDRGEFPGDMALAIVPGDLTIRDEIDARVALFPADRLHRLALDRPKFFLRDFSPIEAPDRSAKSLIRGGVPDPRIRTDDRRQHHLELSWAISRFTMKG